MWDVGHPHLHLADIGKFPIKVKWLEVIKPTCCRRPCPSDCKKGSTMRLEKAGFPSLVVKKVTWGSPTGRFEKNSWPKHDLKEKNWQWKKSLNEKVYAKILPAQSLDACLWREISTSEFQLEMLVPLQRPAHENLSAQQGMNPRTMG